MLVPSRNFNFFDDPFFEREDKLKVMNTDIIEKDNEYEFHIELPGFKKEDIKIEFENGQLNIHAKNVRNEEEEKDGKIIRQERYYGEMSRSFYVGENIEEDIKASFKNGVLLLTIPKKEEIKDKKKYIEIQ